MEIKRKFENVDLVTIGNFSVFDWSSKGVFTSACHNLIPTLPTHCHLEYCFHTETSLEDWRRRAKNNSCFSDIIIFLVSLPDEFFIRYRVKFYFKQQCDFYEDDHTEFLKDVAIQISRDTRQHMPNNSSFLCTTIDILLVNM